MSSGLPDNASYRRYADLQRPYVVWNVFATSEFSVTPKEWCFPFAGCVGYKGYFAQDAAEQLAAELRKHGDDVYTGGVPAYSTLGWLDDPILNTFIHYPDAEIARLIFHELAHQVAYAKGDTTFNESFAVTVEQAGMDRWLAAQGTPQQRHDYEQSQERKQAFVELVEKYRAQLQALYGQPLPAATMRARKQQIFDEMRAEYQELKQQRWDGYSGLRRLVQQAAEQCTAGLDCDLHAARARVREHLARELRRPAALLSCGAESRQAVAGRTRQITASRCYCVCRQRRGENQI